jgi:excisionase family DNA binding protein
MEPFSFALPTEVLDEIALRVVALLDHRATSTTLNGAQRWLSIDEAAEYARCSRKRIYDLRSSGRLSRTGDGSRVLVDRQELDDLIGRVR